MQTAIFFMRLVEVMFFLGLAGSAMVVIVSFVEYTKAFFEKE